ncbi:60S ribosomal protein L35a-1-like [Coffea eugenioides]|uniref:60S ribosomal protein L35a-1-like n=1 Tax=Coffea eugenioides TaxID=49369 RepID=UPI000F6095CD|nr:60S ribosomal protein L35a-1-like [Coffea eugenioides]
MVKGRQGERVRHYVRGTILGYKRSQSNQYPNTSLIQIEGVNTKEEVAWYLGKKMAYIYKAKVKKNGSHYRCIWGKVCRPHGNMEKFFMRTVCVVTDEHDQKMLVERERARCGSEDYTEDVNHA